MIKLLAVYDIICYSALISLCVFFYRKAKRNIDFNNDNPGSEVKGSFLTEVLIILFGLGVMLLGVIVFTPLFLLRSRLLLLCLGVEKCLAFNPYKWGIALVISMILGVVYSSLLMFFRPLFFFSEAIFRSKNRKKRGNSIVGGTKQVLIFTIILIPFFLISGNSYILVSDDFVETNSSAFINSSRVYFEDIEKIELNKRYDADGVFYKLECNMIDKQGKKVDILHVDNGIFVNRSIWNKIKEEGLKIEGFQKVGDKEFDELLENSDVMPYVHYKLFAEEFMNN